MVHRVIVCRGEPSSAGEEQGASSIRETSNKLLKKRRGRGDAIVAIKEQLLRCSSEQGRRRFKRGHLAGGDAADSAIFYLACLVCAPASRQSCS
jgi:hypothetical protein